MVNHIADDVAAIRARLAELENRPVDPVAEIPVEAAEFKKQDDCGSCFGGGWRQIYSPNPPAFEECTACGNPRGLPSP